MAEDQIEPLRNKIDQLAQFVHLFAELLGPPTFVVDPHPCFRFSKPDARHFCLLRACRSVSALYAATELARRGFIQEICVLIRTVSEFCTQTDLAVLHHRKGIVDPFVSDFFADDWQTRDAGEKRVKLAQKKVHQIVGGNLDQFVGQSSHEQSAASMLSASYLNFSNYVHGRHIESMDLFGGRPGHFHLYGMSRTPKDREILDVINTFITTVSLSLVGIAQGFDLINLIRTDRDVWNWYCATVAIGQEA